MHSLEDSLELFPKICGLLDKDESYLSKDFVSKFYRKPTKIVQLFFNAGGLIHFIFEELIRLSLYQEESFENKDFVTKSSVEHSESSGFESQQKRCSF